MSHTELTNLELEVLKEVGNINAGNAATSMSQLIGKKVDMQVPSVKVVAFDEVMNMIGGREELIVAIMFDIVGDTPGTVYFILSKEVGEELGRKMMPEQAVTNFKCTEVNP